MTTQTHAPAARRAPRLVPSLGVVVPATLVGAFVLAAVAPSVLAPGDPTAIDLEAAFLPPSTEHLLGTDQSGRDLWTRVVHGTRHSLLIGLGATGVALAIAAVLGFAAGLGGRLVDRVVGSLIEVSFAFPTMLLALLLVAVRGPSPSTLVLAVGIGSAPGYARMIRGQVLAVRQEAYVEAALALGHRRRDVVVRHVLPNAMRPLVAVVTLGISQSVVWASGLAFLGMGVAPPSPEWGALLEAGRTYVTFAWWLEVMPGLAIVLLAVSVTALGRAAQRRLEGTDR
ncbi:ABC transporter permease [Cellulomonas sp. APG4]|uniref:ABC transporter permease n=1 Tax=Cellulomonas sp. APG4 TaxID=1538656 RepID=UPI00137B64CB|nr:ABC transporter permease [Cellulomonas sp. APG4]NCT91763.1 ABC transporter permease [Cellulomonas sp. APG4]